MTTMSDWIRASCGRTPAPTLEPEQPAGHLGVGRGGTARFAPVVRLDSVEVSDRIRRAAMIARSTVIPQGVDPFA
jgi:hypothetical protein